MLSVGGYSQTKINCTLLCPSLISELQTDSIITTVYLANDPVYRGLPSEAYLTAIWMMLSEHYHSHVDDGNSTTQATTHKQCTDQQDKDKGIHSISINGLIDGVVSHVNVWVPPPTPAQFESLAALCVHANALRCRYRESLDEVQKRVNSGIDRWVMPRDMRLLVTALQEVGIERINDLKPHICDGGEGVRVGESLKDVLVSRGQGDAAKLLDDEILQLLAQCLS